MSDSPESWDRNRAVKTLVMIGEMYPSSTIAKRLDGGDENSFETMVRAWMQGLKGIPDDKIALGLDRLMKSGGQFEPALPAFLGMCKGVAAHQPYKALPPVSDGDKPASVEHYPRVIRGDLERIGLMPKPGETKGQFAARVKEYKKP